MLSGQDKPFILKYISYSTLVSWLQEFVFDSNLHRYCWAFCTKHHLVGSGG